MIKELRKTRKDISRIQHFIFKIQYDRNGNYINGMTSKQKQLFKRADKNLQTAYWILTDIRNEWQA